MSLNDAWARLEGESRPSSLTDLLQYARGHYASHTDWYLKHRDTGFKAVAALLTIMVIAILLTRLAIQSCTQAYKASMEHAALIAKIVWALGLSGAVTLPAISCDQGSCPFAEDTTLSVPRYVRDALRATNTDDFVSWNLAKRGTTFHATKWTLVLMAAATTLLGAGASVAVLVWK